MGRRDPRPFGPACRKLADRAREQVQAERPRFPATIEDEEPLVREFMNASSTGDVGALAQLLAADAVLYTDGGGQRRAAPKPIYGSDRIVRFVVGVRRHPHYVVPVGLEWRRVNQLPGYVMRYADGTVSVAAFEVAEGKIRRLYLIANPDKLEHLRTLPDSGMPS